LQIPLIEFPDYKSRRAGFYKGIGNPLIGLPDYKSGRAAEIKNPASGEAGLQ
jgi:hypothetical protein